MFKIGDLVQHRRGGMKALVIGFDEDDNPILAFLGEPVGYAEAWVGKDFEVI
jgi:hypothetical protein